MSSDAALLQAILDNPGDDARRLVYADWLEEQGDSARAELIRVCQAMWQVPVFSDEYWRLKARRNELRPACPADWLATTGYDGSRYDPIYCDGIPRDWRGRWRLIREFAERWHGLPMGDVGGRREEVRKEEERLGRRLPPSVREYIAYAHDVFPRGSRVVHRDVYTMEPIEEHAALSVMVIAEGNVQWAIRYADLRRHDPPVYAYYWADDDETRYVPSEEGGPEDATLSDFVLEHVSAYKSVAGRSLTSVRDVQELRKQLEAALPVRVPRGRGTTYEGDGILVDIHPAYHREEFNLDVSFHPSVSWERVPDFLRVFHPTYHRDTHPAQPSLRAPAASEPTSLREDDEIPF